MAHVQPQTQCTITGAAREQRSEVKKKEEKKHLEFKIQITVSIKETGTRETTLKKHLGYSNKMVLYILDFLKENCADLLISPLVMIALGPCRASWRCDLFVQWHWTQY